MCGFYIHGRTFKWESDGKIEHWSKPMEVNAHHAMPNRLTRHILRDVGRILTMKDGDEVSDDDFKKMVETEYATESWDWGIRPGNGKFRFQRHNHGNPIQQPIVPGGVINVQSISSLQIQSMATCVQIVQSGPSAGRIYMGIDAAEPKDVPFDVKELDQFMPAKQQELIAWCNEHWGKNGDESEFVNECIQCLDLTALRPHLPSARQKAFSLGFKRDMANKAIGPVAIKSIANARDPLKRFTSMFKDAPNEYWAAKV